MYVVSTSDHVHIINSHLAEWLFNASVEEAPNPYSRGIFKKESQALVTEPDGSVCRDFFTLLNIGTFTNSSGFYHSLKKRFLIVKKGKYCFTRQYLYFISWLKNHLPFKQFHLVLISAKKKRPNNNIIIVRSLPKMAFNKYALVQLFQNNLV